MTSLQTAAFSERARGWRNALPRREVPSPGYGPCPVDVIEHPRGGNKIPRKIESRLLGELSAAQMAEHAWCVRGHSPAFHPGWDAWKRLRVLEPRGEVEMQTDITCSDELDETQSTDLVDRLRWKLTTCGMPSEALSQLRPEIAGLSNATNRRTMEYFHCLADLPWRSGEVETVDVQCAQRVLNDGHFGLAEPKMRILEYLAVRHRTRDARGSVLCLVGPPGVGKTSLAASVAAALGRRFAEISCNGLRETADVHGARRDYAASHPGQIMQQLRSVGARNPVFILDEIDKVPPAVADALLDALDPMQNKRFHDLYVGVPFDLSAVFFVATANVIENIPTTLRNRLEMIEIAGYSEGDKLEIARRFLVAYRMRDHGLTDNQIKFTDEGLRAMIRDHASEMGVRDLDRSVSAICRRAVLRLETSSDRTSRKVMVTESMVGEVLVVCPRNDLAVARTWPNGSSNGDSGPNRRNASQIKRQLVQGTHH